MPISKPHSTLGATNTSSCIDLAMYLEKENNDLNKLLQKTNSISKKREIESRKQFFFSHSKNNISTNEVISSIDNNIKKLGKKDAKYFAPTISFSQNELKHIIQSVTDKKEVKNVWELNIKEYELFNKKIKEYTKLIMTNYAKNFNRENKGLKSQKVNAKDIDRYLSIIEERAKNHMNGARWTLRAFTKLKKETKKDFKEKI